MRALPFLLAFLAALALRLNVYGAQAAEDASRVGVVDKVENEAQVISASGAVTATVGAPVHLKDELRTGANARLQVTFLDETQLTLGEHASVVIDRYVYDPDRGIGETVLQATKGAFRFATGRIKEMKDHRGIHAVRGYRRARHRILGRTAGQIWGSAAQRESHGLEPGRERHVG